MISIIVPVYNVEKYISKCIESIINQSVCDWELLLINDGSKDNSGSICDSYSENDKRIKVFHKINGGVSSARNLGLEKAKGDWICFVDSDDWVDTDFLANFLEIISNKTELAIQSFYNNYEINDKEELISLPNLNFTSNYSIVEWLEKTPKVHNGFIWHRIYKRSIIDQENIRFEEGISFAEDGWFFFKYMRNVQNIKMTSKSGYHYLIRNNSLTSTGKNIPAETLSRVLCGYIESLSQFCIPFDAKDKFSLFTKKYSWRLAESWFIKRGIYSKPYNAIYFNILDNIITKYRINNIPLRYFSLYCLTKTLKIKNISLRNNILKYITSYRELKRKIINYL